MTALSAEGLVRTVENLLPREHLLSEVETRLSEAPITVLLGAHQTGKTALAHMAMARREEEGLTTTSTMP